MDESFLKSAGSKSMRPVRNRRYSRKSFGVGQRPAKRLFTPEIKRFLKDWLVRRRENPYPNREEKKILADETGLTYIQICNWFANWRRKLKNAGSERHRKTWGHLIKTYNNQAQGNVEQFSICSDDSIWGEPDPATLDNFGEVALSGDHCYSAICSGQRRIQEDVDKDAAFTSYRSPQIENQCTAQCYHVSSTTEESKGNKTDSFAGLISANKYKNNIMKKYLKGLQSSSERSEDVAVSKSVDSPPPPVQLTKWRESAANFQPRQSNYVTWNANVRSRTDKKQAMASKQVVRNCSTSVNGSRSNHLSEYCSNDLNIPQASLYRENRLESSASNVDPVDSETCAHGREEVEAAVTLTRLASLYSRT